VHRHVHELQVLPPTDDGTFECPIVERIFAGSHDLTQLLRVVGREQQFSITERQPNALVHLFGIIEFI